MENMQIDFNSVCENVMALNVVPKKKQKFIFKNIYCITPYFLLFPC